MKPPKDKPTPPDPEDDEPIVQSEYDKLYREWRNSLNLDTKPEDREVGE